MRNMFVRKLHEHMKKDNDIVFITGDLGFGALESIMKDYPKRFINAGISEQNMMSIAAGLAYEGKKVFVYSIGNFPSLRCLEQIRNDVLYHNLDVKIVSVGSGFSYGGLGMSHHATEDASILKALPNMNVLIPTDPNSVAECMDLMVSNAEAYYLKLGKVGEASYPIMDVKCVNGRQRILGHNVCIISIGPIIEEAYLAIEVLNRLGIFPSLYEFNSLKPFDDQTIIDIADNYETIITLEEHTIIGGLGSSVADVLATKGGMIPKLIKLGLNDTYSAIVGDQKYLRDVYGMSCEHIIEIIKGLNIDNG